MTGKGNRKKSEMVSRAHGRQLGNSKGNVAPGASADDFEFAYGATTGTFTPPVGAQFQPLSPFSVRNSTVRANDIMTGDVVSLTGLPAETIGGTEDWRGNGLLWGTRSRDIFTNPRYKHRNICSFLNFDWCPQYGCHFYAMPLREGCWLSECRRQPVSAETALEIALSLARALGHFHTPDLAGRRVVHGWVEPASIFLRAGAKCKVLLGGFGRATYAGDPAYTYRTGGSDYFADELLHPNATAAPAGDVFALGAVLCELVTGQRPRRQETDRAPVAWEHNRLLILARDMMVTEPDARPTIGDVVGALHAIRRATGLQLQSPPPSSR